MSDESKQDAVTLKYWGSFRGRCEGTRMALHAAGIEYTEAAVSGAEYGAMVSADEHVLPFNQLPVLHLDGMNMGQSGAILVYLGQRGGFFPSDKKLAFQGTMIINGCNDYRDQVIKMLFKRATVEDFEAKVAPRWLKAFEKLLTKNTTAFPAAGNKFMVGTQFSSADIAVFEVLDSTNDLNPELLKPFPTLKAYYENVPKLNDKLASYLTARADTRLKYPTSE